MLAFIHQLPEGLFAFDVILPKEGEGRSFRYTLSLAFVLDAVTIFVEIRTEFVECSSCFEDSGKVLGVTLEEELDGCEVVEEATHTHDALELVVRQVLV